MEASLFPYNFKNPQNMVPFLGRSIQPPNFCDYSQFGETINDRGLKFLNEDPHQTVGIITSPCAKTKG